MSFTAFFDYDGTGAVEESTFLPQWADGQWRALLDHTSTQPFAAGETLLRVGDAGRSLFIVASGQLEAVVPGARRGARTLIEPGSLFGELSFFDGLPRSADVVAVTDGDLLRLGFDEFETFSARHPDLARELLLDLGRLLAGRLRRAQQLGAR